ncbi:sulfatase-like hydrolase/transferase [Comamonas thiooxydans]|uniref:sulfatase-like hydrolase/transferase n=1 Tax=Comamonas thiooxydans TaxID=363952 RepID=UPI0013F401A8|nr:sulfatase-like hydrolase/transferase [Comamonas thiooxydans]
MMNKNNWRFYLFWGGLFFVSAFFEYFSYFFGYKRYLFSFEMFFAFFLLLMKKKRIAILLFIFATAMEFSLGMSSVLYLFEFSQLGTIFGFFSEAKKSYIFGATFFLFVLIVVFFLSGNLSEPTNWRRSSVLGGVLLLTQLTFSLRDGNFMQPALTSKWNLIFGSSFYINSEVMKFNREIYALESDESGEFLRIRKPSAVELNWSKQRLPDKIMLVVAESWGKARDERIVRHQISSLARSNNIDDLKLSYVPSGGATIYGEFRELCGLIPTKLKFKKIDKRDLSLCLPHKLTAEGYKTVSLHGAHGTMYDRITWYPLAGIQKMLFREVLPFDKSKECYSFPGYCDRYLFKYALSELKSDRKVFLYWMSLNSHTPYEKRDVAFYDENICREYLDNNYSDQLCAYHQLHLQFFEELEKMAHNNELKGMRVIVVGDHAPIFNDEDSREKFERNQVSAISFSIK